MGMHVESNDDGTRHLSVCNVYSVLIILWADYFHNLIDIFARFLSLFLFFLWVTGKFQVIFPGWSYFRFRCAAETHTWQLTLRLLGLPQYQSLLFSFDFSCLSISYSPLSLSQCPRYCKWQHFQFRWLSGWANCLIQFNELFVIFMLVCFRCVRIRQLFLCVCVHKAFTPRAHSSNLHLATSARLSWAWLLPARPIPGGEW